MRRTIEIEEQREARKYCHGSQWTEEQIRTLRKRKQPIMTFNRISSKVNGIVGVVEKLRQDPKALVAGFIYWIWLKLKSVIAQFIAEPFMGIIDVLILILIAAIVLFWAVIPLLKALGGTIPRVW